MSKELIYAPQIDKLQIIELISVSEKFSLFKAQQTSLDRLVIVKTLSNPVSDKEAVEKFSRMVSAHLQLRHSKIQELISQGFCSDLSPFALLEFIPGDDIEGFVKSASSALDFKKFELLFKQVLQALDYVHNTGTAFDTIEPSNIIVSAEHGSYQVKLANFSLLEDSGNPPNQNDNLTEKIRANIYDISCIMLYTLIQGPIKQAFSEFKREIESTALSAEQLANEFAVPIELVNALLAVLKDQSNSCCSAAALQNRMSVALSGVTTGRMPLANADIQARNKQTINRFSILALALMALGLFFMANFAQEKQKANTQKVKSALLSRPANVILTEAETLSRQGKAREALYLYEEAQPKCKWQSQSFLCLIGAAGTARAVAGRTKGTEREFFSKKAYSYALQAEGLARKLKIEENVLAAIEIEMSSLALRDAQAAADRAETMFDHLNDMKTATPSRELDGRYDQIEALLLAHRLKSAEKQILAMDKIYSGIKLSPESQIKKNLLQARVMKYKGQVLPMNEQLSRAAEMLLNSPEINADGRSTLWSRIHAMWSSQPKLMTKYLLPELTKNNELIYEVRPQKKADWYAVLGECYLNAGDLDKAKSALETAYETSEKESSDRIQRICIIATLLKCHLPAEKQEALRKELADLQK